MSASTPQRLAAQNGLSACGRLTNEDPKPMDFLTVNGKKLEYAWLGPGPDDAPTLVFLHEGLGCAAMWHDFPAALVERTGCGALVFSRAGYGGSDACELPRPVRFMHDEGLTVMPALFEAAGLRKAILIGHSDGGSIALIFAGGLQPSAVLGMITMAAHVHCEPLTRHAIEKIGHDFERGPLRSALERYHGPNTSCAFRGWKDVWLHPDFVHWNIEEYLPRIFVPLLAIQGDHDRYGTAGQIASIKNKAGAGAEILLMKGCGHAPHKEFPDATLGAMHRFIQKVLAKTVPA